MTGPAFETFLARLYVDERALTRFLAAPAEEAARAGLDGSETEAALAIDQGSLRLTAQSFAHKRAHAPPPRRRTWWQRLLRR